MVVHSSVTPSDEEWNAFVTTITAVARSDNRVSNLVFTDGGAPTAAQRSKVNALVQNQPRLTAVIADSALVRGVVTAFNWFNPAIKVFSPSQSDQAFRHLNLSPPEVKEVLAIVGKLKTELRAARQRPA
ncbi:MAG: hypothetical protein IT372_20610 [Polyangiaceae bacterium]|nr:hypothetical protein [Polyangiaceae bacterium]